MDGDLALVPVVTGVLVAILLFAIAGVTGTPSLKSRTPALILTHRSQLVLVGVSILFFSGFGFMLTLEGL